MAKRTKTLVGLDIDATGIVAASVVVNGGVRIERVAFKPLEAGIIRDGEVADVDGLAEALKTLYHLSLRFGRAEATQLKTYHDVARLSPLPAGADMLRKAHRVGSSAFKAASTYRWLPDSGVLVRTPRQSKARVSVNGAAAASPSNVTGALPGLPVWAWQPAGA